LKKKSYNIDWSDVETVPFGQKTPSFLRLACVVFVACTLLQLSIIINEGETKNERYRVILLKKVV